MVLVFFYDKISENIRKSMIYIGENNRKVDLTKSRIVIF
jgi:hypothetical protein